MTAALLLSIVVLLAIAAPLVWGDAASAIDTSALSEGPSAAHWLGTDSLGRDGLWRVLVATRLSIVSAVTATAGGVLLGLALGAAPWLLGARVGRVVTAVVNIAIAFPYLLIALFFAVIFGVGIVGATLSVGLAMAPYYARVVQNLVAGVEERDFIAAARTHGQRRATILLRHILPNIAEPLAINATLNAGAALLSFAGLSLLGIGVQPPEYDWGLLMNEGLQSIYRNPAGALAPGLVIILAALAFNLLGETVAKHAGHHSTAGQSAPRPVARRRNGLRNPSGNAPTDSAVLAVEDLVVTVGGNGRTVSLVRGIDFVIGKGEAVGLVGESGSGKSLTALAVAQLLEEPLQVNAARLDFLGTDLTASTNQARHLLGTSMGVIFQNPTTSLNPTMRVGAQLAEVATTHQRVPRRTALAQAIERLRWVRIPAPARRARQYPHEFSGGMRQRAMIGMALMGEPSLLIADEPTTALDVTVQRRVLDLLQDIRRSREVSILFISHDLSAIRRICDRVLVMYAGRIVEDIRMGELPQARHPYTRALLASIPSVTADRTLPLATIPGRPVDLSAVPSGCAFAPRCSLADGKCRTQDPPLRRETSGNRVACWHADIQIQPARPSAKPAILADPKELRDGE
ncbi:dipeptide/oligopeptide/nickel ABC transporter permease/ATP-binding protein [Phytohabitans kaempferiae]|uniref:Dipeptide/oligopeptide/nickel ABC transporter permease/ATP-binding protein n=1 Tax=Phytohabitans kaempferiae TaxID=1620943 RepID=A0ABV6M7W2_9ACTN